MATTRLTVYLPPELHRTVGVLSALRGETQSKFLARVLRAEYEKPEVQAELAGAADFARKAIEDAIEKPMDWGGKME